MQYAAPLSHSLNSTVNRRVQQFMITPVVKKITS